MLNMSNFFGRSAVVDDQTTSASFEWLVNLLQKTADKIGDKNFVKLLGLGVVSIGAFILSITFLPMIIQAITMAIQSTIMLVSMATTMALSAIPLLLGTGLVIGGAALFGSTLNGTECMQIGSSLFDFFQKTDVAQVTDKAEKEENASHSVSMFIPILKNADKGASYCVDFLCKKIGYTKGTQDVAGRFGVLFAPVASFVHTQISPRVAYLVSQNVDSFNPVQVVVTNQQLHLQNDEVSGCLHTIGARR